MTSAAVIAQPFICGGLSAITATTFVHPIDLSKVRLQLFSTHNPGAKKPGFSGILLKMIKEEGFLSIYSGISAAWMRQAVYGTARIGLHRSFSEALVKRNDGNAVSFQMKTLSGMASGSIAVCLGTPFDVALVRMQGDSMKPAAVRRGYKNVFDALLKIASTEGVTKLYSGLVPNILRGMSMNVGMLACYDQAKEMIAVHIMNEDINAKPSLQTRLGASLVAGFTASAFSLPFDLIKSRLQDGGKYTGIVDCATKVLTNEGFFAFWTGFSAYYMRTAPHAMILLMLTQPINQLYKQIILKE